jgi:hypothetical protein
MNPPTRRIYHAVERHEGGDARVQAAQASWDTLYENGVIPCHYWRYERTALEIGDHRALPFLKDVLKSAMDQAGDDDIIFWTNDDNLLHPQLPEILRFCVSVYDAVCSQRCEFKRRIPVNATTEDWVKAASPHMGCDLFAFKKSWLTQHWNEIPDFILGASIFDLAMACLIRLDKGIITTQRNIRHHIFPAELPLGYIGHVWHKSSWNLSKNARSPAEKWNKRLFQEWAVTRLPELKFDKFGNI